MISNLFFESSYKSSLLFSRFLKLTFGNVVTFSSTLIFLIESGILLALELTLVNSIKIMLKYICGLQIFFYRNYHILFSLLLYR